MKIKIKFGGNTIPKRPVAQKVDDLEWATSSELTKQSAEEFNAAIPLTAWQDGAPPCIGEWNASIDALDGTSRRWWNGTRWSFAYSPHMSEFEKQHLRKRGSYVSKFAIKWRGLSSEPRPIPQSMI